jgi:hypothetical protein
MLSALFALVLAHPEATAVAVVSFAIMLWKRLPASTRAEIERRHPRVVNALRVLYALFPDLLKAAAAARGVAAGMPKPEGDPTLRLVPRTRVKVGSGAPPMLVLLVLLPLALAGCPRMPAPDGCTPAAQRCHEGAPQVCSQSGRWTPADTRCDQGTVCCRTLSYFVTYPRPIYACVPQDMCVAEPGVPVDGGAR